MLELQKDHLNYTQKIVSGVSVKSYTFLWHHFLELGHEWCEGQA